MIFIKKIRHATNEEWGICEECKLLPPTGMLCGQCVSNRSKQFHRQVEAVEKSWEYRIRFWLSNFFKPEIKFK